MLIIIEFMTTLSLKSHFVIDILKCNLNVSIVPISGVFEMLKTKQKTLNLGSYVGSRI